MPVEVYACQPILSIAIPTYNRSPFLAELIEGILPDLIANPASVQFLVSDNCSTDDTQAMLESFRARGLALDYIRNPVNIGSDANFLNCLNLSAGKYVWVLGDDDILTPQAIPQIVSLLQQGEESGDFDLVYLSSFAFSGKYQLPPLSERQDKLGRFAEVVTDGAYFLEKVNALIGLISVNIVNKNRLLEVGHPPIENLNRSSLLQVGWLFPLIRRNCRVLYIWQRLVAYRSFNSGGWAVCELFGVQLHRIASDYFSSDLALRDSLMNGIVRYWLPPAIVDMRRGDHKKMVFEDFARVLRPVYRSNWRFWLFIYTVSSAPMRVVEVAIRWIKLINKLARASQAVYRHTFRRSIYLHP
jgi:glycosyltransferase involved in cell wall biosynthesis